MDTETSTEVKGSYNTQCLGTYKLSQMHPSLIHPGFKRVHCSQVTPEPHLKVPYSCQPQHEGKLQPHFFLTLLQKVDFSSSLISAASDPDPRWEMQGEASRGTSSDTAEAQWPAH